MGFRITSTDTNTFLTIKDENNTIQPFQCSIYSRSGWGKGLFGESIAEVLHNNGYLIIVIADPKNEIEYGYAQFLPEKKYHLNELKKLGNKPATKKVKVYHPFTFNLPNNKKLPEMNIYTLSMKDLRREEWSLIAETPYDSDTIKILLDATPTIKDNEGIYSLLHHIQEKIKGKKQKKELIADPDNFYLSATAGTVKSLQDISNYFKLFRNNWFIESADCPLNLDIKKILSDQEHYHVFISKWINDSKASEFIILSLLNRIIQNTDYVKHPICFIIPEVKFLTPYKPKEMYKIYLASGIKDALSTIRSKGKGMSSIIDAQTFSSVDEEVRSSSTDIFFGEIGNPDDIENIAKKIPFRNKKETLLLMNKMDNPNSFILKGSEDIGTFRGWLPRHMHCEPEYNYLEMYKKHKPEQMKRYDDIIKLMKQRVYFEKEKIRNKLKEEKKKSKQEELEKEKEREEKRSNNDSETKKKLSLVMKNQKEELINRIVKLNKEGLSNRKISQEVGVSNVTVGNYLKKYNNENNIFPRPKGQGIYP